MIKDNLQKYNLVFFGASKFSTAILEELKNVGIIPSLIVTAPDKPRGRGMKMAHPEVKTWANENRAETIQPEKLDDDVIKKLKSEKRDLFLVASYGKIIPKEILDIPIYGALNVHPSLLPKLRGASPIQSAILNNERDAVGITIILMDEKIDNGPIVAQMPVEIEKWPPRASWLENLLAREGGKMLARVIPDWVGKKIGTKEQNRESATFCKKIEKEEALINFGDNPYLNYRKIQAFDVWPRAYFFAEKNGNKTRVIITDAKYENNELKILRVIPEGKKEISYEDFVRNFNFK